MKLAYQKIKGKYKDIDVLLKSTTARNITDHHLKFNDDREKRSIFGTLFGGAFSIIGSVMDVIQARRTTAIESSVSAVKNQLLSMNEQFVDLQKSSYTTFLKLFGLTKNLTKTFSEAMSKNAKELRSINNRVRSFEFKLKRYSDTLKYIVSALSEISITYSYNLNQALAELLEYDLYLERFVDGLGDIVNGQLSTSIIPPSQLNKVLDRVKTSVELRKAHLKLLDVPTQAYYNRQNTIFAVYDGKLFIQLEVFTTFDREMLFTLFEISTIPMPFDMTDVSNDIRPYTQLIPNKKFFAVSKNAYMDLDNYQINGCEVYDKLHVCPQATLQRDSDSMSCISNIWYNSSKSDILSHCEFRYLPKHKQEPNVLDTGLEVLISGFETPWTIKCEHDFTMQHFYEVNYAVIPHNQLCGCAIMGKGMHVKTFLEGCYEERDQFRPVFPVNEQST